MGVIKGDTRSLDCSSNFVAELPFIISSKSPMGDLIYMFHPFIDLFIIYF